MTFAAATHLLGVTLFYGFAAAFVLVLITSVIGHVRMVLWKRRHRNVIERFAPRPRESAADEYVERRPWW